MCYVKNLVHESDIHAYDNKYEHPATINSCVMQKLTDTHIQGEKKTDKKDKPLKYRFLIQEQTA